MVDIRKVRGKPVDLDKAAEELQVPKESLLGKYNRPILQKWAAKEHGEEVQE
jgi:hypothetical protein